MSMRDEFRTPLDDEIDDVARSLTAAPPSPALRSAVRRRIPGHADFRSAWRRWPVSIAAAAAVIALATVWPDRKAPVDSPASSPAVATVTPPPALDPSIEPRPTPPGPVAGLAFPGSPGEPARVRPTSESLLEGPTTLTEPLVMEPLELNPLGVDGIEIRTLTVEALSLEPLSLQ